jgi:hypothetical protein
MKNIPDTPEEREERAQSAQRDHALAVAIATIEAFKATAEAFTDTPGPGERSGRPITLDCGCSFGPRPKAKPR